MTFNPMTEIQASLLPTQIVRAPNLTGVAGYLTLPRQPHLTPEEIHAVVTRNSVGSVHHMLADGAIRTSRVRYVRDGSILYIPAWTSIESWYASRLPTLQCDISEVDWFSCWRYVWLRGEMTPLHPTGAAREREGWRQGVSVLRRVIVDMAPTDDLALANFGIVRMDIESWNGAVVAWGESALTSSPVAPYHEPR